MPLNVAVQMDHIATITIRGDSTFALMLEASAAATRSSTTRPTAWRCATARVERRGSSRSRCATSEGDHFKLGPARARRPLALRRRADAPGPALRHGLHHHHAHLLERIHPKTLVVNDPAERAQRAGKALRHRIPRADAADADHPRPRARSRHFRKEHGDIIIKPLYGNGGAGVFRIAGGDENLAALLEMFETAFREPFIVQRYLPEVRKGDKRIILVDGEAVGAINRVPAAGEARSNMHVGGRPEPIELTAREREICAAIGPTLKGRGLIFVGIDVIGDYLTEINVTSPTGIREIKRFGGADIAALIWDAIEAKVTRTEAIVVWAA